jgi:hypothetical protein
MTDEATPSYADTLEAQVLIDMVSDGKFLVEACQAAGAAVSTVYSRIDKDERFAKEMERARRLGFDVRASNTLRVARGEQGFSTGDVKRDTLICKQENHMLAKWHPTVYGDKLQVEQKSATVAIPTSNDPIEAQRMYEQLMKGTG